jgi:Site-specific recombinase XerD
MKIFELKEDTLVTDWLDNIKKSNTIKLYLLAMQGYTEFLNKCPDALINEAEEESKLLARKRNIKKYLIGFKKHMIDKGLSPMTQKAYMAGVKAFYTFYDIELPKIKIDNVRPLRENKGIPTKEDIQEALKVCDPLETAVLLVGATSGLSANEISNLRIDDFKKGYDPTTGITTLDLRRQKVELDFITFLTPEASKSVNDYLIYRARTIKTSEAKRIRQLEKQRVTSDTGYLFIQRSICDDYLIDHDEEYRKIAIPAFMEMYRTISEKAQKNTPKGNWNLIRSHNLRRWFNTTLLNAGMGFFYVEEMMGHTLPTTQENYYVRNPDKLKEIYKKYIPYLTIQKDLDISVSPEYQAIIKENDTLRAETARHIVERTELNDLRKEIETIYHEMKKTQDGFNATAPLMHKIHPNRLLFPPDSDDNNVDPDHECM